MLDTTPQNPVSPGSQRLHAFITVRDRLHLPIAVRIAAAVFGGYALAHTLPIALAAALPVARADAALFAIQGSFLGYAAAVLWAFTARSALAAWLGLLVPAVLTGLVAWVLA